MNIYEESTINFWICGLLIAKCKLNGGFIFNTYTTLYDSLVWSIISYDAAIWGTKEYSCINAVQNRAVRFYLGVGKYTPNLSVIGDMGWKPSIIRQWSCVLRNWQRCTRMDSTQLNKKVFLWANRCATSRVKNWQFRVSNYLRDKDLDIHCNTDNILCKLYIRLLECNNFENFKNEWCINVNALADGKKLRTYKFLKN